MPGLPARYSQPQPRLKIYTPRPLIPRVSVADLLSLRYEILRYLVLWVRVPHPRLNCDVHVLVANVHVVDCLITRKGQLSITP
jgi:hypothetical protein